MILCHIACGIFNFILRVVLGTDVVVAVIRSERGASRQLLLEALDGNYTLLVSTTLWLEYEVVLTDPADEHVLEVAPISW